MQKRRIYFRADGSNTMGLGHIYRACALAQILADKYSCHFLISQGSEDFTALIGNYFPEHTWLHCTQQGEAAEVAALVNENDIVVLDGYHFDTSYQEKVKAAGCKLVCIDDIFAYRFVADAVINHAGGIPVSAYDTAPHTKLFLGPQYAIIREPFLKMATERQRPVDNRIMISLGGADPDNHTSAILKMLLSKTGDDRDIHVVAGAKYHFLQELQETAQQFEGLHLHQNIDGASMAALMASAALCIATPSTVAFEYFTAGNGRFVMQLIADNQISFHTYLKAEGFATDYNDFISAPSINTDSAGTALAKKVFDAKSHRRLQEVFANL